MRPIDYLKALGVAAAILAANYLIAILAVVVYSIFVEPGHPPEYYEQAALRIVPWVVRIFGTVLFFVAGYVFTRRRPERNAFLFAMTFVAFYAVIDAATVMFKGIWNVAFGLTMLGNLAAALMGAFFVRRKSIASSREASLPPG